MVNAFVDGEWRTDANDATDKGEFTREEAAFRDRISPAEGPGSIPDSAGSDVDTYPPEAGRYHLYISRACPWAHGVALARRLAGLTDLVTMDVVDPYRGRDGWTFSPGKAGCTADTVNGFDHLREAYVASHPDYTGRVTVPVLWDRDTAAIVNNESIEIMRMLATAFLQDGAGHDLYPTDDRGDIDDIVEDLYEPVNNGVYRAAIAGTRDAYADAVAELFDALERWNAQLSDQRYLAGNTLTLADLRLFPTLVRFDAVYHNAMTKFGSLCLDEWRRITDYDHLGAYRRDLFQHPGVSATVDFAHILDHYSSPGSPAAFTPTHRHPGELAAALRAEHHRADGSDSGGMTDA